MRMIHGKNVLRTSAFALACLALAGSNVKAATATSSMASSTMDSSYTPTATAHTYSTGYTIANTGISSPDGSTPISAVSFTPLVTGAYTTPSALSLGQFQVSKLNAGQEVDYNNTPFTITYNPLSIAGMNYPAGGMPVTIHGSLTGSITGSTSSVTATFGAIDNPTFASSDKNYMSTLSVLNNPLSLVASSAGGVTTVQAMTNTTSPSASQLPPAGITAPEPTTFAILATALVGLGFRHRLRSGRKAS